MFIDVRGEMEFLKSFDVCLGRVWYAFTNEKISLHNLGNYSAALSIDHAISVVSSFQVTQSCLFTIPPTSANLHQLPHPQTSPAHNHDTGLAGG